MTKFQSTPRLGRHEAAQRDFILAFLSIHMLLSGMTDGFKAPLPALWERLPRTKTRQPF